MTATDPAASVLVVGAGPVGLAAACGLAAHGAPVRVVEALARPTTESRAVMLQSRTLEQLAVLGVLPDLDSRGSRMVAVEIFDGRTGTRRARIPLTDVPSHHPYALDLPQTATEAVLADRATQLGVVIDRGVTVTALAQDADGVDVTLRSADGERTERFGWVVGADGGHSTVRDLVGARLAGSFHGQHFALADVDVDIDASMTPDTVRMFTHPDGMGILFPLGGRRVRIMFQVDRPTGTAPTVAQVQDLADERMGADLLTVHEDHWLSYFEIHHAQVPQYRHGRVLLAGDAAHIHSPAAAQGMNTGIQDATNLAWKLALVARGRAGSELLDSYHDERHPVGATVVRETTALTAVGTATGPAAVVRNLALFLVGHVHAIGDTAAATMAETAVHYRGSTLSGHDRHPRAAVRPGEHAPDPAGITPAIEDLLTEPGLLVLTRGEPVALREVLRDRGTVVRVVRDGTGPDTLVDPHDAIDTAYGLGPDGIAVIRPDGYLGLVADTSDPELLRRYLADHLNLTDAAGVR
jgi:2-polyprenyl-6-methoxyphenol hydroxylase-like FAD-dependent oxidoreductase